MDSESKGKMVPGTVFMPGVMIPEYAPVKQWAIVSLKGHGTAVGQVTVMSCLGQPVVEVYMPELSYMDGYTRPATADEREKALSYYTSSYSKEALDAAVVNMRHHEFNGAKERREVYTLGAIYSIKPVTLDEVLAYLIPMPNAHVNIKRDYDKPVVNPDYNPEGDPFEEGL